MARHALLIGVSVFKDDRLAQLNAPIGDVRVLGAVLSDPERGGFSVEFSIDDDYLVLRDKMAALFDDRDPDDLLLLYYSGHGILARGNRLYLATSDSDLDHPHARSLYSGELRDQMDLTRAEQQVLVLDCCHSGAFAVGAKGVAAPAVTEETFAATAVGRYVLTASTAQQFAWEGGNLRQGSPADRELSRFTSWLVDGLKGQAAPDDEQITVDAVFRYVSRRAKAEGSPSTPLFYADRRTGELVIARSPAALGTRRDVPPAANLQYLLVTFIDDRDVLADGVRVGTTNHIIMLPADEYIITLSGDGYSPPSQSAVIEGTSLIRPKVVTFIPRRSATRSDLRRVRHGTQRVVP